MTPFKIIELPLYHYLAIGQARSKILKRVSNAAQHTGFIREQAKHAEHATSKNSNRILPHNLYQSRESFKIY